MSKDVIEGMALFTVPMLATLSLIFAHSDLQSEDYLSDVLGAIWIAGAIVLTIGWAQIYNSHRMNLKQEGANYERESSNKQ